MTTSNYYSSTDYSSLRAAAMSGDETAVNELGRWMTDFGNSCWNGEYYDIDDGYGLYPVYGNYDEEYDQYDLVGYEIHRA